METENWWLSFWHCLCILQTLNLASFWNRGYAPIRDRAKGVKRANKMWDVKKSGATFQVVLTATIFSRTDRMERLPQKLNMLYHTAIKNNTYGVNELGI